MHLSISQSGEAAGLIRADQLPLAAAKRWPMSPGLAMMMIILSFFQSFDDGDDDDDE